jgi:hypothetical protein
VGAIQGVICNNCQHNFAVSIGGGFFFHLLHCDACGGEKTVGFSELGRVHNAHVRYVKGLPGPWTVGTRKVDKQIQEHYPAEPLSEDEYHSIVERFAGPCGCGGSYRFDAPPRCPRCKSSDLREDEHGIIANYD